MSAAHDIGRRSNAASGLAGWLSLAAAPTFAAMALVSAASPSDPMTCMMAPQASPLTGMAAMYVLMCAFHLAPWIRLLAPRNSGSIPTGACVQMESPAD
jgi:hypothetical protein